MRFRDKVLMINIILLSLTLGIVGFLMIQHNFSLALDTQIQNAIVENNLLQSSVEYEFLSQWNNYSNIPDSGFTELGNRINSRTLSVNSVFYIWYDGKLRYCNREDATNPPEDLFTNMSLGKKLYEIKKEQKNYYIYVTSISTVNNTNLCVITKSDITQSYKIITKQTTYYRFVLLIVLLVCAAFMYFISTLLTRPLEQLNTIADDFANGNYSARSNIQSHDEIELLSNKYNHMADAVEGHIQELQDVAKRREQFVSDFTHEIKTPMTTIIGYADTIRSKELSRERQITAANYIFSEGKRLEEMSFKLFDLIYLKDHPIETKPVSTKQLAESVSESMKPALEAKSITLFVDCESASISGDYALLESVFINLIDNAKKASSEGDSILLNGKKTENGYQFQIIDHGIGMTEEQIGHIFDEFYMVDKSRSRKEGGAGLGLSLVSIILNKHDVKMEIKSELGSGTTISLLFPVTTK